MHILKINFIFVSHPTPCDPYMKTDVTKWVLFVDETIVHCIHPNPIIFIQMYVHYLLFESE